jgi:septum formation protein
MVPPTLILASTSRYRRALLERLGLPFQAVSPACDEEALKDQAFAADPGLRPQALAELLAEAKAASIAGQAGHRDAVVIGSDQLAALEVAGVWTILGKPGTQERAVDQLTLLSGRSHVLITSLVVARGAERWRHTDLTTLTMRPLGREALARYVAADQPLDCAGAYKLECRGVGLFAAIASADASAITGLPLLALTRMLAGLGYAIP